MMIHVVAEMIPNEELQARELLNAIAAGDWYYSPIPALADADQATHYVLEQLSDREYRQALFNVYGVFKFELTGLAGTYDN